MELFLIFCLIFPITGREILWKPSEYFGNIGKEVVTMIPKRDLQWRYEMDPGAFRSICPTNDTRFFGCNYGKKYFCVCKYGNLIQNTATRCDRITAPFSVNHQTVLRIRIHRIPKVNDRDLEKIFLGVMENPGGLRKEKIFITRKECVVPNAHMLDYYFPVTPFLPPEIKPEDASILDFINLKALFDQERLPIVSAYYYPYHGLTATPDSERDSHGIRFDKDEIRQYYSTPKEAYVPPPNNKTFHQFDQPGVSEAINGFFLLCDVISIICIILAVKPELAKTFCDSFKPYRPASYNNFRQTSL